MKKPQIGDKCGNKECNNIFVDGSYVYYCTGCKKWICSDCRNKHNHLLKKWEFLDQCVLHEEVDDDGNSATNYDKFPTHGNNDMA